MSRALNILIGIIIDVRNEMGWIAQLDVAVMNW